MISPKSYIFEQLCFSLFLLFSITKAHGQCNPEEGGSTCHEAPFVCLNNLCDQTEINPPDGQYIGWCGPLTSIENPQYFAFIADSTDVYFQILVGSCTWGGNAIQAAILDTCPWSDENQILDCENNVTSGNTFTLSASGLNIGNTYYLVFDGSAGAQCAYTIQIATGVYEVPLFGDLLEVQADPQEQVCQGFSGLILNASPVVGAAHGYWWYLEWLQQDTIETTDPELHIDIPTHLQPGIYEICVQAFSGCDIGEEIPCIEIEVYEIPEAVKTTESYCTEEFPFIWGNTEISGPGVYSQAFIAAEGCFFDSLWVVEAYPEVPVGFLDTLHCEEFLFYEGNIYNENGTYPLDYPGMGLNGCDSTAELNVTLTAIDALIELGCQNGEFVLSVHVSDVLPWNANLEFQWYKDGIIFSTEDKLNLLEGGVFEVIVEVITPAGSCFFPLEMFTFSVEDYQPDPPITGLTDTNVCAQPGIPFEVMVDPFDDPFTYTWSAPMNVPVIQNGSTLAIFDFSSALDSSQICVYATNECGDGPPTCFNVDILPAPIAVFTYESQVCADSTTVITFTGAASVNAEVIWDFNNPTTLVGAGTGPYTVSWAFPGDKTVALTVIEPGCDTAFFSQVVTVSSFTAPVINCSSTINSVHFDWDDVVGATGYLVSINGGAATPTTNSEWDEIMLPPGTVINLTLTVVSGGPCDDIVVTAMCTAEDCPAPTIEPSGQDSACLNNPTIIDLDALVNGVPGTGTWSGLGIIDVDMGLFDPKVAGPGLHQVIFTVIENGCPFSAPYSITVFDSLTADFVLDPLICQTDVAGLTYTGSASGSAMFDWDFGSATVVAGSGSGPYQLRWASPGNQAVRLQVRENGCTSDLISQPTNVIATLNPPIVICSPNTSGILFSWTVDASAADHDVNTLIGPLGTPVGTDSLDFTNLVSGDTVQIEIVTISAGPCPDRRDTLLCIARHCPTPNITITPVDNICLYPGTGTVDLVVTITNSAGGSGEWAGPGVTDVVTGVFNPVVAGPGAHQITYSYNEDGCDFIESITINVYAVPDALISNTDLMITCAAGSIILDGSSSSGGPLNYLWTTTGTGFIDNGAFTSMAEVTAQGVYQLHVSNAVSGCADSTSARVTHDADIPIADAGPDQIITCKDLILTLGGNSTMGVNITYHWTTPDGHIIGPITGLTVDADATGAYTIVVRDTSNGCQATDQAMIRIDTAVATITIIPGDTIDCNTPISSVQSIGGVPAEYAYSWSTTDGTIEGAANGQIIQVSQGGTYTLTIVQHHNGCENTEDTFVPESEEIIDTVDVSVTHVHCHGDNNGTITVNGVTGGIAPYTYDWSGTSQSGTDLTNLGPGFYTLTVTDHSGCSFVENFEVIEPELVTVNVGPDMTVRVTDSVFISLVASLSQGAIAGMDWNSSSTTINCPGCPSIEFIATNSTIITAILIDTSGCDVADSMQLTVLVPKIYFIPNVFSPNDDGNNDYFTIWGRSNLVNIAYLRIHDRWGNQLFETIDILPNVETAGWDGKFNGEPMQPAVYVYTAQLDFEDGNSENVSGDITIIR